MPNALDNFIDVANEYDVDKTLLKTDFVSAVKEKAENIGVDLGETVKTFIKGEEKKAPTIPSGPTPTYKESVLEPKNSTALYNVTNTHKDLPLVTKCSKFFKDVKYRVKGFNVAALKKSGNNNSYGAVVGEKAGVVWSKQQGSSNTSLQATYNVGKNKTEIEYSEANPVHSYSVSVFSDDGNKGVTAAYSNRNGFNTVFSADEHSAAVKAGLYKKYDNCNVDLNAFATTGENYKDPFVGVSGRITF